MSHVFAGRHSLTVGLATLGALAWSMAVPVHARAEPPPSEASVATCIGGTLEQRQEQRGLDLEVTGPCTVPGGTFEYGHVNIWGNGRLTFSDAEIHFWTRGIIVENGGTLSAGTPAAPIGTAGGTVTIHLYGADQGTDGTGVRCKSDVRCGVPEEIWRSNLRRDGTRVEPHDARRMSEVLPEGDFVRDDYFYAYKPLPFDGADPEAYFGYKMLAISYGGTLELFGKKGASYCSEQGVACARDLPSSDSGTSWARLSQTADGQTLFVDRTVDWEEGDEIVVTTTDYLPGHSEQRTIQRIGNVARGETEIVLETSLDYEHSGQRFDLSMVPDRLGLDETLTTDGAETRAAVGVLTRSIRIVSEGDALGSPFPDGPGQFFGGHTVIRQGFEKVQIQGVEFYQMGQGGRIAHYPIHFHHARLTAPGTFVKDSSIHDSMTRWVVLHGTQDVTLARNVGYLSIGHGFYLEDGTEINNKLYSNLGVFARAAVDNAQNPRKVPGILAAPDLASPAQERVPFRSDYDHPTVFWIMNGWNEFEHNVAAGASACGVCYWLLPGATSGGSRGMKWESYASMEHNLARAGMSPLKSFVGNSCTSSMTSFNTVGNTAVCHGVGDPGGGFPFLDPIENELAPASTSPEAADYYPIVDPGGGRFATTCDQADCSTVPRCSSSVGDPTHGTERNCTITTLDRYTSSFHWAEFNFAAIWLRPQWYLVENSVLTDVQGGGLNFVTGGGYSASDRITGHWALVNRSAFIGSTQKDNPFAYDGGPFNPDSGLVCEGRDDGNGNAIVPGNYCLSHDEGVSFPVSNFGMSQRMFSVYDGPAYQASNAYVNIRKRTIDDCEPFVDQANGVGRCDAVAPWTDPQGLRRTDSHWLAGRVLGLPKEAGQACYMPNAAIGWKQPNGFYYPPAFHSRNLSFHDVDIRHFLIQPLFEEGSFDTDLEATSEAYCGYNNALFTGFTDIDRQTVLNDDDGSLTGFARTISVNVDPFFRVPVEDVECLSDETANVSPYEYVTTVIYPRCAVTGECALDPTGPPPAPPPPPHAGLWDLACSNQTCFGVPLFRQQLTGSDLGEAPSIQMMGQSIGQRSSLTVNNGIYYVDTTISARHQLEAVCPQDDDGTKCSISVFRPNETYYLFMIFAKETTKQTYQIFVGKEGFDPSDVFLTQADIRSVPITFGDQLGWPDEWPLPNYDPDTGVLEVTIDLSFASEKFDPDAIGEEYCRPFDYCHWDSDRSQCVDASGSDEVCGWGVLDVECPAGGCFGIGFTMGSNLATDADPRPEAQCFDPKVFDVDFVPAAPGLAGSCPTSRPPRPDFCSDGAPPRVVGGGGVSPATNPIER